MGGAFPGEQCRSQGLPNEYQIGLPAHGDFSGSDVESVRQLNNNKFAHRLASVSLPGRGGPPVGFNYIYDSKGWGFKEHCGHLTGTCTDTVTPTPGVHNTGPS